MKNIKRCSFLVFPLALATGPAAFAQDAACVWAETAADSSIFTFLGSADFDALEVAEDTISFGGAEAVRCAVEDAGADLGLGDGYDDLVCRFRKRDVAWPDEGSDCDWVEMTAELSDGTLFAGVALACLPGEPTCEAGTPTP